MGIRQGSFLGIVGPNGSGKTTLLRAALGILTPRRGRVHRPSAALRLGYVPQRFSIDPIFPLRVRDLVMMGRYPMLGPLRRPRAADRSAVERACDQLGIADLVDRLYRDLSGGQQQRALIARAMAAEPRLLVLDEPTNGMDLGSERSIMELVRSLHSRQGVTVLFVTHLLNLVANAATDLALVHDGSASVGRRDEMLRADRLSAIYATPVEVREIDGTTFVFARETDG